MAPAAPKTAPQATEFPALRDGKAEYRLRLPGWGRWLAIVDAAATGDQAERADIGRLLREWLRASAEIRPEGETAFRPLSGVADLPAVLADRLVTLGAEALEAERKRLAITVTPQAALSQGAQGASITSAIGAFTLRALSFAERNACLRGALVLGESGARIEASRYEQALVAASLCDMPEGLSPQDVKDLPLVLGEALIAEARRLSDPRPEAELQAFAEAGQPHPDLELAALCLTFGLTPAEAEALPAATARRLNAAARLLSASGSAAPATAAPVPAAAPATNAPAAPDNMTRIVVHDD